MSSGRPREVSFPNRIRVRLSRRDRDLILKHNLHRRGSLPGTGAGCCVSPAIELAVQRAEPGGHALDKGRRRTAGLARRGAGSILSSVALLRMRQAISGWADLNSLRCRGLSLAA